MADQIAIRPELPLVDSGSVTNLSVWFRDRATSAASTPSSIRYRVDCLTNGLNVINWTSIAAANSATIQIPGTSNAVVNNANELETRQLMVEIDTGLSTQVRNAAVWKIKNNRTYEPTANFDDALLLEPYYPATLAEDAALVTPTNYGYLPGDVPRQNAKGDGSTSDTTAFTEALTVSIDVHAGDGTWMIQGVTVPDGQSLYGDGRQTVLKKRANGAVLSLAKNAQVRDLYIDGNGASFTGAGITIPATIEFDGFQHVYNCVVRNTESHCVEYSAEFAGYCSILLGCDFKTTDEDTTEAVKWGQESSAIKHGNRLIVGCTAGSGPIVDATSSQNGWVVACMAGGAAVAGITYSSASAKIIAIGNRLAATATQTIDGTSEIFQGNVLAGDITVAGTADGCVVVGNYSGNITIASGAQRCVVRGNAGSTVTDNSGAVGSLANLVEITHVAYTPVLSSANSNASLGDGTLTGYYSRNGRTVKATARLIFGSTTTFGTGAVRITLPFTPSTNIPQQGAALLLDSGTQFHVATARTLTSSANVEIYPSAASGVTGAVPFTFVQNDEIQFTIVYDM